MDKEHEEIINIFWTGGWDSTYRLLELLVIEKKKVATHYLIDHQRPSAIVEQAAMERIRKAIYKKFPEAKDLFLPTKYKKVENVPQDDQISNAYSHVLEKFHFGSQYEWLARYCKHTSLERTELGIIKPQPSSNKLFAKANYHDKSHFDFHSRIKTNKDKSIEGIFDIELCSEEEYKILRYFSLPLFNLSKEELGQKAKKHGFYNILGMSWFCHRPMFGRFPCGRCNPCADALREGFAPRVGLPGIALSLATRIFKLRKVKAFLLKLLGK